MKVCLLQMDLAWCSPEENRRKAEALIRSHAGADLYVLPEMFSTGFVTEPQGQAEPAEGGSSLAWMRDMAATSGAAVAGSVAVEKEGRFFNRFYFVKPGGEVAYADKRHLFTYGGEHRHYTPGTERVVAEWQGVRILLLVCYDLRFPVWSRSLGDYDLILYVANWPSARQLAWDTMLRARAIENQCYVAGVNRVGADNFCAYSGGTALIDAYGRTVVAAEADMEQAVSATLDMPWLTAYREKFPVRDDADNFHIMK